MRLLSSNRQAQVLCWMEEIIKSSYQSCLEELLDASLIACYVLDNRKLELCFVSYEFLDSSVLKSSTLDLCSREIASWPAPLTHGLNEWSLACLHKCLKEHFVRVDREIEDDFSHFVGTNRTLWISKEDSTCY